jgi:hypothetical protein
MSVLFNRVAKNKRNSDNDILLPLEGIDEGRDLRMAVLRVAALLTFAHTPV